jgi:pyridoxine 5'-phosphate synthase PdxJ
VKKSGYFCTFVEDSTTQQTLFLIMINLSVNVNKIATLRNARGGNTPDVQQVAIDCERFGADGITVHPRPDERHIRRSDVYALRPLVRTEFNIEGYPSEQFMDLVLSVRTTQATLVPDAPGVLTSSAGWEIEPNMDFLCGIVDRLKEAGIRTHIIVCVTAALIMLVSKYGFADLNQTTGLETLGSKGADPARVAAQAVSGISFLCAGVIFKVGSSIKGLTTAAGIWMTAGIGLAVGAGMYVVVAFTAVLL